MSGHAPTVSVRPAIPWKCDPQREPSPAVVLRAMARAAGVPEIELLTSRKHTPLKLRVCAELWRLGFDYKAIGAAFGKSTGWATQLLRNK